MFDIGWSEMALIMLVALIVIGPKDLPRVARTVGRWVRKGRALAREFQNSLEDMAREAELDKVKEEIERAGRGHDIGKSIEKTIDPTGELGKAFDPTSKSGGRRASDANGDASKTPEPAAPASRSEVRADDPKAAERESLPADPS